MSRKLLFGFALLVCAALIGVVVESNGTTYADDSEKASPNGTNATPPATNTPAAQPEPVPSALPENELPLYPDQYGAIHLVLKEDIAGRDYDVAVVDTIVNGYRHTVHVQKHGALAEEVLIFRLRTDGWKHASAQLFGKSSYSDIIYSSAVVLVPDEESLKLWQEWMARELKKKRGDRAYPANVLPPK